VERPKTWVVANFGEQTHACSVPAEASLLLASSRAVRLDRGQLTVPVDAVAIVALDQRARSSNAIAKKS
jgi:hypothetical protein